MPDPIYLPLSQAAKDLYYGASCETCKETRGIDLEDLAQKLGADFPLNRLGRLLRCQQCGGHDITIVTLYRNASTSHAMVAHWK